MEENQNKNFYRRTLKIAIPLSFQSFLSSAMGIVDTMMVSSIGMVTAVGTANQLPFLSRMVMYGAVSGTGIFASQFFGSKDYRNLKRTFGFSLVIAFCNAIFWFLVASFFSQQILLFYLNDPAVTYYSAQYLDVIKYSLLFSNFAFSFSFIYRSVHLPKVAVSVNSLAMILNVIFNLMFIFGFGIIPAMGIKGAAIGTLLSQIIRLSVYIIYSVKSEQPFIGNFKELFDFDKEFILPMVKKMIPLLVNETMFGIGSSMFIKIFGTLGKESMDAYYVGNQIYNIFLFVVYGFGGAIAVLVGSRLGEGKIERAKFEVKKYLKLSLMMAVVIISFMLVFAKPMVKLFSISDPATFILATQVVSVLSIKASLRLFNFVSFSVLRAGGDTKVIQFLDSGILWLVGIPTAFIAINYFGVTSVIVALLAVQLEQLIRMVGALYRVISGKWAKNITTLVEK
ncbi:MAG: MATE family efflux transporter [Anaerorhabdus sp.]